jgi:hypothetical protein
MRRHEWVTLEPMLLKVMLPSSIGAERRNFRFKIAYYLVEAGEGHSYVLQLLRQSDSG